MADLKLVTIPPPYNGMNTVASPGKCPEGMGPLVRNFLVHVPGKLAMRGPLTKEPYKQIDTNAILASPNILTGAWAFNNKLLLGFTVKTGEGYLPPWMAPFYQVSAAAELSDANTTGVYLDLKSGTAESITYGSVKAVPGNKGTRLEKYVFGYGYDSGETFTGPNGESRSHTWLLRWDGTKTSPTVFEKAPRSALAIKTHLNRLWTLGGDMVPESEFVQSLTGNTTTGSAFITEPTPWTGKGEGALWEKGQEIKGAGIPAETTITGSGLDPKGNRRVYISKAATETKTGTKFETRTANTFSLEPSTLRWTRTGTLASDLRDNWTDEVTGLENKIIVGDDDQNDFGIGLGVANQTLVIFKRYSIWALYGYSPSTFQIRNLTKERGCIDPNSIYEDDGGIYFVSQHGMEFFNGDEFILVDAPIANTVRPLFQKVAGEKGISKPSERLGRITINYAGNDYLFLSIAAQNPRNGSAEVKWAGYMHTPTGNWSEFSTTSWASQGAPMYSDCLSGIPWCWDGRQINPMPFLTDPWTAEAGGFAQRDISLAGTPSAIPAKFQTDRIQLGSPGYNSQYHRFMFDYRWWNNGLFDESAAAGWYVTLFGDKSSDKPINEVQAPGQASSTFTTYINGRRWEKDIYNEAISSRLQVEWKESENIIHLPEVYDSTIELEVTRQRRSV